MSRITITILNCVGSGVDFYHWGNGDGARNAHNNLTIKVRSGADFLS